MSPATPTHPPNDRTMWRCLVARSHPDAGGDHDLFIWTMATRDVVCGGELGSEIPRRGNFSRRSQRENSTAGTADRIPFEAAFDKAASFEHLTMEAVGLAANGVVEEPYARILANLADCHEVGEDDRTPYCQQHQGATYKSLAAIAYKAGMSKAERVQWYRIAESIPLSQRHAGHLMMKLGQRAT